MYEVELLDIEKDKRFTKRFNSRDSMYRFIRKVNHSKKIKLLLILDNSYMYD